MHVTKILGVDNQSCILVGELLKCCCLACYHLRGALRRRRKPSFSGEMRAEVSIKVLCVVAI